VVFFANTIYDQYQRSYMKAQSVIANIGGVIKSVIIVCKCFVLVLTKNFYLND